MPATDPMEIIDLLTKYQEKTGNDGLHLSMEEWGELKTQIRRSAKVCEEKVENPKLVYFKKSPLADPGWLLYCQNGLFKNRYCSLYLFFHAIRSKTHGQKT